jgi:hypothetical protein
MTRSSTITGDIEYVERLEAPSVPRPHVGEPSWSSSSLVRVIIDTVRRDPKLRAELRIALEDHAAP